MGFYNAGGNKKSQLRITGNYKLILNPRLIIDEHLIPRAEHIFSQLKGAKLFCHLDITDAYSHLVLDEQSSHALTLNTPTHDLIHLTRAVWHGKQSGMRLPAFLISGNAR